MNRSLALFVALAVLLAHAFALHTDVSGSLAPPYDGAYAALELGSNLAHEGSVFWLPGQAGLDAHPSILWVFCCALGKSMWFLVSQSFFAQALGALCGIGTLVLTSGFHRDRIASLIAPLLLAVSGSLAAASMSGSETALLTMLVVAAFFAYERHWGLMLGVSLALCGLCGIEGWFLAAFMLAFQLVERLRHKLSTGEGSQPKRAFWPYLLPLIAFLLITLLRWQQSGQWLSPSMRALVTPAAGQFDEGLRSSRDFLLVAASPCLILFSLWYFLRGRLTPTGLRAMLLFVLLLALEAARGGGAGPFAARFVPTLPLALIAAQEGMICALDSPRRSLRGLAWLSFLLAITFSILPSRKPRDLGPLPLAAWQESWLTSSASPRFGREDSLGRAGVTEELEISRHLRGLGLYLRSHVATEHSILSPWPGSVAHLSHKRVFDALGRTNAVSPGQALNAWSGEPRVDLQQLLSLEPDYIVPTLRREVRAAQLEQIAREWQEGLDLHPEDPERLAGVRQRLEGYELIFVPVSPYGKEYVRPAFPLLRRKALDLSPRLRLAKVGDELVVLASYAGPQQLADLYIEAQWPDGRKSRLTPSGQLTEDRSVLARLNLLLHPAGEHELMLYRARLPQGTEGASLRAQLLNPGLRPDESDGAASGLVELAL